MYNRAYPKRGEKGANGGALAPFQLSIRRARDPRYKVAPSPGLFVLLFSPPVALWLSGFPDLTQFVFILGHGPNVSDSLAQSTANDGTKRNLPVFAQELYVWDTLPEY